MTRGELEIAWSYNRTLYHNETPVKIYQLCSYWSKSETAVVKPATKSKDKQWRCGFEELSAIPRRENASH